MKRLVEIIEYVSQAITAIAGGVRHTYDHWPVNSPFVRPTEKKEERSERDIVSVGGDQVREVHALDNSAG